LKLAGHQSCPGRESVIGRQTCCPVDLADDEERVIYQSGDGMQYFFLFFFGAEFGGRIDRG
ncbi:MAG TPA: hypothetical protein VNX46_07845, partial [Candidatus Acidoferrum sp.]|nr:hypothetical protein [Candidatus Acidoferrum sp.]